MKKKIEYKNVRFLEIKKKKIREKINYYIKDSTGDYRTTIF